MDGVHAHVRRMGVYEDRRLGIHNSDVGQFLPPAHDHAVHGGRHVLQCRLALATIGVTLAYDSWKGTSLPTSQVASKFGRQPPPHTYMDTGAVFGGSYISIQAESGGSSATGGYSASGPTSFR